MYFSILTPENITKVIDLLVEKMGVKFPILHLADRKLFERNILTCFENNPFQNEEFWLNVAPGGKLHLAHCMLYISFYWEMESNEQKFLRREINEQIKKLIEVDDNTFCEYLKEREEE